MQQRLLHQITQRPWGGQGHLAHVALVQRGIARRQRRHGADQGVALPAQQIFLALEQLGFAVQHRKQIFKLAHALGASQKQHAARVERVVKQREQLFLQVDIQIDQHVAAANEVELGERRVFDQILFREHQQLANTLLDAVELAPGLQGKKPGQPLRAHVGGNADRKHPQPCAGNGAAVYVGGKHLHGAALLEGVHALGQQDGE